MKRIIISSLLLAFLMAACSQGIGTVDEALDGIRELDSRYGTNFSEEQVNKLILTRPNIESYLADLEELRRDVDPVDDRQERWINWLFETRKQMLEAQHDFQQAWLGIGEQGRVSDGFKCSDITQIRQSTRLLESSWAKGVNATRILDSLLTENEEMREVIGIGDRGPLIYDSGFDEIYLEARSNVVAMKRFCDEEVETKYLDFSERLEELEEAEEVENVSERT